MKLTPPPRIKLSRLRDIGWRLWDPIGLLKPEENWNDEDCLSFADEYDSYLIQAASQIRSETSKEDVAEYLVQIELVHMGLTERPCTRERAAQVVDAIASDPKIWTWPDEDGRFR